MLPTYPFYYADNGSVVYEQPGNIGVTISCCFSEWSVPAKLGKKKNTIGRYSNT